MSFSLHLPPDWAQSTQATTRRLLARYKKGEASALQLLFQREIPLLRKWARGRLPGWARSLMDTADLVQDALARTLPRLMSFESRREKALQAYLRTAVANQIRNELRRVRRAPELSESNEDEITPAADTPTPDALLIEDEERQRFARALSRLSEVDRTAVVAPWVAPVCAESPRPVLSLMEGAMNVSEAASTVPQSECRPLPIAVVDVGIRDDVTRPPRTEWQTRADLERLFLANLPTIRGLASSTARRRRLPAGEAEDFEAVVLLKMVNNDYAILRRFRGQSALRTFLAVVIERLFLDYRDAQWGKWRPSAKTRRAGGLAVSLEQLTIRDGLPFDQACAVLAGCRQTSFDVDALHRLYVGFRARSRPLPAQDRLLLKLRFACDLSIAAIARKLRRPQKPLYPRLKRLQRHLRAALESSGLSASDVLLALGESDVFAREPIDWAC